jgi:transcriptional regulator GlxA family with amidase domain
LIQGIFEKPQYELIKPGWGTQTMVTWSRQKDFRIQQVVQVLNENPSLTLPELARDCQMSMSRLSHLFKNEIGINVKDYRMECRLQVAAAMLALTRMPIKEIAYTSGYRHSSSFARAFKTHFGLSPARYRTRLRQAA